MDIVVHIPPSIPYSCLVDGLMVGAGNGPGRLVPHMAKVENMSEIFVSAKPKQDTGPTLRLRPNQQFLVKIETNPVSMLEALARQCMVMPQKDLFMLDRTE